MTSGQVHGEARGPCAICDRSVDGDVVMTLVEASNVVNVHVECLSMALLAEHADTDSEVTELTIGEWEAGTKLFVVTVEAVR